MAQQKALARAAWKGSGQAADDEVWFDIAERVGATEFTGYTANTGEAPVNPPMASTASGSRATCALKRARLSSGLAGLVPIGYQASPSCAVRRSAGPLSPPTQIGGRRAGCFVKGPECNRRGECKRRHGTCLLAP